MPSTFRSTLMATIVIAATSEAPQVQAQQGMLEEVTVTARKRSENIQEVPIAISAISSGELRARSVLDVIDLSQQVPNLDARQVQGDPSAAFLAIRGQAASGILLTQDSAVGAYIDGVNLPRSYGLRNNILDLDRVEVLKGPQGTLYGRNTTGGALKLITKKPVIGEFDGYLQGTLGNYDYVDLSGAVNVPVSDSVAMRFAVQHEQRDGFGESKTTGDELSDQDETFLRGSMVFNPSDRLNVLLTADYSKIDNGGSSEKLLQPGGLIIDPNLSLPITPSLEAGVELGVLDPVDIPTGGPTFIPGAVAGYHALDVFTKGDPHDTGADAAVYTDAEVWGGSLAINYDINDEVEFLSLTGYREVKTNRLLDLDGSPFLILHPDLFVDFDFFSQEFQVSGATERLDWVVGAYYSREDGTDGSKTLAVAALNPTRNITEGDITNTSWALFSQVSYDVFDALSLTGGLRWTEEKKKLTNKNRLELASNPGTAISCRVPPGNIPLDQCAVDSSDTFSDPSWLVSADYQFNDEVMVYASISHSWRGGGQNMRADGEDVAAAEPFEPEYATNYEIGLKGDSLNSRLRFNGALFFTDLEDSQRSVIVPGAAEGSVVTVQTNAADAEITGFEMEIWYYLLENLSLFGTVGYTDFEYQEYESLGDDGVTIVDRSDEDVAVPEWQYSISARYDADLGDGDLVLQLDYAWVDDVNTAPGSAVPDIVTQDSYGLLNARVDWTLSSGFVLSLWGRNLADEEYFDTTTDLSGNLGHTVSVTGAPRTYGATLRYNFDN